MWFSNHILTVVLFVPLAGAILLMLLPKESKDLIRWTANLVGFAGFLVSVPLVFWFDSSIGEYQFVERAEWIPSIGANYALGMDGISLLLVMLTTVLGILALYFWNHSQTGQYSFDIVTLSNLNLPADYQIWIFFAFFVGFAIKVPMFPFHTWLPDAHVEAPTAGAGILAGGLLKMGTYGFVRFSLPLFPPASLPLPPLVVLF